MRKKLSKELKDVKAGDLIEVIWADASIGKSLDSGPMVDIPVHSWGVFVAVLGEKNKHIILGQNSFRYADGLFDIDYTAIPLTWTESVKVLHKQSVAAEIARQLLYSFMKGGRRGAMTPRSKTFQRSLRIHGGLD
jgi:hypothetical protein